MTRKIEDLIVHNARSSAPATASARRRSPWPAAVAARLVAYDHTGQKRPSVRRSGKRDFSHLDGLSAAVPELAPQPERVTAKMMERAFSVAHLAVPPLAAGPRNQSVWHRVLATLNLPMQRAAVAQPASDPKIQKMWGSAFAAAGLLKGKQ